MQTVSGVNKNMWRRKESGLYAPARRNFPPNGLVLYLPLWHPELSDDTTIYSKDLIRHTCDITGALWGITGRDFDGSDDTIIIPNHAALNFGANTDFTLMAWAKTAVGPHQYMIFKGDIGAELPNFFLRMEGTSNAVQAVIDDGTTTVTVTGTTDLEDDKWHLYAATFDRDGNLTVYVDGVSEGTPKSIAGVGDIDNAEDLFISGRISGGARDYEWNGLIGEGWIYNRLVSAETEQSYIYNHPARPEWRN